jgi:hypothetical protein
MELNEIWILFPINLIVNLFFIGSKIQNKKRDIRESSKLAYSFP